MGATGFPGGPVTPGDERMVPTTAKGDFSAAIGEGVNASSFSMEALGRLNMDLGGSLTYWVDTDPLFVIGNGYYYSNPFPDGVVKKNAVTVLKNGNVGINSPDPGHKLHVEGQTYSTSVQVGNSAGPITSNWWEFGLDTGNGTGIDFHSNSSPGDYSARIYREPGDNGKFDI